MKKFFELVKREVWTGYSLFERIFLVSVVALQIAVFCIVPDSPINIIAGIAGAISVVMCAKGRLGFYFIGFVQTISYLVLAWQNCFYGEVLENLFYFVTMIWGIFAWKKNMGTNEDGSKDVLAKKFTVKQWILSIVLTIVATIIMGYLLTLINSAQAYTDAATNVMAIFAQILMVKRYREQWIWWLAIDLFCVKMWFVAGNWSMVAMYIAWTVNCIYGWINWSKLNKVTAKKNSCVTKIA